MVWNFPLRISEWTLFFFLLVTVPYCVGDVFMLGAHMTLKMSKYGKGVVWIKGHI